MAETARTAGRTNAQPRKAAVRKPGTRPRPNKIRRFIGEVDRPFLIIVVLLVCVGLITVFSASYSFAEKYYHDSYYLSKPQLYLALLGLAVMALIAFFPSVMMRLLNAFAVWFFVLAIGLNLLVPFIGVTIGGATRWIKLGPLPQFQPSELLKFGLVLIFAWYISRFQHKMNTFLYGFIGFLVIGGAAMLTTLVQNHLSATIIIILITVAMMWASGCSARHFFGALGFLGVAGVAAFTIGRPILERFVSHAFDRFKIWQNPFDYMSVESGGKGWQPVQSLYAISSGSFWGVGIGQSIQKKGYLPEPYNDYIFAILCEETGFFGAVVVILLFGLFAWRGYRIAFRSKDRFASLIAFGITTHVVLQVLLNLGVVTNTIPSTGISLPFFSHGGTSLLILLAEMGFVLAVSRFSYDAEEPEKPAVEAPQAQSAQSAPNAQKEPEPKTDTEKKEEKQVSMTHD